MAQRHAVRKGDAPAAEGEQEAGAPMPELSEQAEIQVMYIVCFVCGGVFCVCVLRYR